MGVVLRDHLVQFGGQPKILRQSVGVVQWARTIANH